MSLSDFDLELDELFNRSVHRLQAAEVFDANAFVALRDYLSGKASDIAAEHVVSKQILGCLMKARDAIQRSAPWVPEAKANQKMADEFDLLLCQIAYGVDPATRQPGVPRIV
ncbi:hypothetical protein AB4076_21540 [Dyella sp. 2RAF44]|jgi:hypothetical protein|uniref:hypothetical protein n=1 Tax=Dyella sp. 2RAF44 TaxID=3233000 RepID=UPI003F8EC16A